MSIYYHSVRLDREKCKGCVNCIKKCPTEAIRVRRGKAEINEEKCIDCGECIRACPNQAKYVETDSLEMLKSYRCSVALPPPSLFGHMRATVPPDQVLSALTDIGFDSVFEVAVGADVVSSEIKRLFRSGEISGPIISSACPAVVRLIQVRFPDLTGRVMPLSPPTEVAAQLARQEMLSRLGCAAGDIGIFFLTPCAAKVTSVKAPVSGIPSNIDGAIGVHQIYPQLNRCLKKPHQKLLKSLASGSGMAWGISGGERLAVGLENYLVVDGIHNVISVLEELEMGHLGGIDFIEAQACTGGCVGGYLHALNTFVARVQLRKLARELDKKKSPSEKQHSQLAWLDCQVPRITVQPRQIVYLDTDINKAMIKMADAERVAQLLPGLDCGACGAPNCKALAEDIVLGKAKETDCIFVLRERIMDLSLHVYDLAKIRPPAMNQPGGEGSES
ncbi:MAG: Periplasmic (Fe) hydrogenase large subunit [Syntrophomonadaceae bacterium]|nr:Periplasmic (Fe) hydrogenase large subunit [Bacillota bacterium]